MPQFKVAADTSGIKKSFADIGKEADKLKRVKADLINPETIKWIQEKGQKQISKLTEEIKKQGDEAQKLNKSTKEYDKAMSSILTKTEKLGRVQQSLSGLGGGGGVGGVGKKGGGFLGRAGGVLGKVPGLGGVGRAVGGLGAAGGLAAAGAGILGGAALYGASRVSAGFSRYQGSRASRTQAQGLGISEDFALQDYAKAGLGPEEARQLRIQGTKSFGAAGAGQAGLELSQQERAYGLDSGTFSGLGGQLRGAVGGESALEDIGKVMESAMISGLEDADIGNYLETAVGYLSSIDSEGIKNRSELLSALGNVVKATGEAPEKIAKGLGGIDSAISGSSGESNAFFQQAFANKGIGGGTIGGTQFALEGGLGGTDLGRVAGLSDAQREQLGGLGGGGAQKRAQAILDQFKAAGVDVEKLKSGKGTDQETLLVVDWRRSY